MSRSPLQPPVPFSDFEFTFDPSLSNLFPNPPPLPSSADLFSPAETTDLLGFLDNFNDIAWDFGGASSEYAPEQPKYDHVATNHAPYSNPHLNTIPEPSTSNRPKGSNRTVSSRGTHQQQYDDNHIEFSVREESQARSTASESSNTNTPTFSASADPPAARAAAARTKPLLSTPQKRLNHIIKHMSPAPLPPPPPAPKPWPIPKLHLRIDDLDHEGSDIFLSAVNPKVALRAAVLASFEWLYTPETAPRTVIQILLVLRPMIGVAVTFGTQSHKEIHFSLDHIKRSVNRARDEIMGVLVHEVVHCFQYNALDTCPGGLIEGIADFVRLHAGFSPPHWKRTCGDKWDIGYEKTAYFLNWIEKRYGEGTIRELNEGMKDKEYHRRIFKELTGRPVRKLWAIYCKSLEEPPETPEGFILWPTPSLKLCIDDLSHKGVNIFLNAINPEEVLSRAVTAAFKWLYTPETAPDIKEITLALCRLSSIAETSIASKDDVLHIEIVLSLEYIEQRQHRVEDEVTGLLIHEIAHCLQRIYPDNKYPSGLLLGIADYVRLKEGYGPPHWKQQTRGAWDAGFETTAYFLEWIEKKHREGTVRTFIVALKSKYDKDLFKQLTGVPVSDLWQQYCENIESNDTILEDSQEQESPSPLTSWPIPKFNIRIEDLDHEGVDIFFEAVRPKEALRKSVLASFNWLYTLKNVPTNVKEILLVLRAMDGVAYTTGSSSHKEIHFSLNYIKDCKSRASVEFMGVLVHEVVHCYQYDARGSCPGGLVEGIADFVRLNESLAPPHWRRSAGGKWDDGYDRTAFFLDWIEHSSGKGTIQKLNHRMKRSTYNNALFQELTGTPIDELWANYGKFLDEKSTDL
ncbi:hypothetical protein CVT25_002952 [Psilocybe cyanescens]|uniref:Uncharacterized protein n=1 Tax=Psilocybe cyanescens TaxID=93625 RepID=A0A409WN18_PSICY|nr:hypothetical protein CVT25_002952 [Psilocybe cyanescens]